MAIGLCDVAFFVCFVLWIPRRVWPLDVEKEGIVDTSRIYRGRCVRMSASKSTSFLKLPVPKIESITNLR